MASINHQSVTTLRDGGVLELQLPAANVEIVPGVRWGKFDAFFTPAFWVARAWIDGENSELKNFSIGRSLREEVAACLLGGFGMPAEVGLAAFERLRDQGLLAGRIDQARIEKALSDPLRVHGRSVRYRYPRTKARFVAEAMQRLNVETAPNGSGKELRNWLLS